MIEKDLTLKKNKSFSSTKAEEIKHLDIPVLTRNQKEKLKEEQSISFQRQISN